MLLFPTTIHTVPSTPGLFESLFPNLKQPGGCKLNYIPDAKIIKLDPSLWSAGSDPAAVTAPVKKGFQSLSSSAPINVYDKDGLRTAEILLPGVPSDNISVELKGSRCASSKPGESDTIQSDIPRDPFFSASFRVPVGTEPNTVQASLDLGILKIAAPLKNKKADELVTSIPVTVVEKGVNQSTGVKEQEEPTKLKVD